MAFRVTEDGTMRVTEAGVVRLEEGVPLEPAILMEDAASYFLLEDGSSRILLE